MSRYNRSSHLGGRSTATQQLGWCWCRRLSRCRARDRRVSDERQLRHGALSRRRLRGSRVCYERQLGRRQPQAAGRDTQRQRRGSSVGRIVYGHGGAVGCGGWLRLGPRGQGFGGQGLRGQLLSWRLGWRRRCRAADIRCASRWWLQAGHLCTVHSRQRWRLSRRSRPWGRSGCSIRSCRVSVRGSACRYMSKPWPSLGGKFGISRSTLDRPMYLRTNTSSCKHTCTYACNPDKHVTW
jgi:hypothetical protein